MPSPRDAGGLHAWRRLSLWLSACLLGLGLVTSAAAAEAPEAPAAAATAASGVAATPVRLEQVRRAVRALDDDPLLGGDQVRRTLRWTHDPADKKRKNRPADWLQGLADWLAGAGRLLAWLGGATLVAIGAVVGWRHWGMAAPTALPPARPSHVGSLDIRPESLPEPIGPAAAELWQQGRARAALALLYRAALSRLVHRHRIEVRSASTEQECLALAAGRLAPDSLSYLERLVRAWLLCGYGHAQPPAEAVLALCADFDLRLGAAMPEPLGEGGA